MTLMSVSCTGYLSPQRHVFSICSWPQKPVLDTNPRQARSLALGSAWDSLKPRPSEPRLCQARTSLRFGRDGAGSYADAEMQIVAWERSLAQVLLERPAGIQEGRVGVQRHWRAMTQLLDLFPKHPYPIRKSDAVRLVNGTNGHRYCILAVWNVFCP